MHFSLIYVPSRNYSEAHQSPSVTAPLSWAGERNGRFMGRDKGRGRSLTCNLCRQNRFDLGKTLFNLLLIKNQSRIMGNENKSPPHPTCSQFLTPCLHCSFLLRGWTPHTLPAWGPSQIVQCDSFSRAEVLHELLYPVPYSNTTQSVL